LRQEALQRHASASRVFDTLETAFAGTTAGQVYRGQQPIDVVVALPPEDRVDPLTVGDLLVQNATGAISPLRQLAGVEVVTDTRHGSEGLPLAITTSR
jgi:cobalt-zinc-cadmium resistance protein CzcA